MTKGSTWNIWDFHLHTPYSILNNQFGSPEAEETWEKYISEIEKTCVDKGIVAIGFTDYFCLEGYKKIIEYKKLGRLSNIFVFPNIEFRLNVIVQSKDQNYKRINLHVIFSPEISPEKIEDKFLHNLDFVLENEPFDPSQIRKLKVSSLKEFGEYLQKQHGNFAGKDPFFTGCMNAVVQPGQIKSQLETSGLKGKYLIILAEEDLSTMDWNSQYHAVRKQLIQMSHGVFSSNQKSRDFYLGKTHLDSNSYIEEFKSFKPCIWGCDSHGFNEKFLEPDNKRYCWIKSGATWNGLKQILYEPEYRVAIQEYNPEPDKSIFSISSIQIPQTKINNDLCIQPVTIDLNHNLVTVIGGRGSGKTAILDLIASCFLEGEKLHELQQSFYYRLYVTEENKPISNQSTNVTLGFKSGDKFNKFVGSLVDKNSFDKSNILYLTQNHFDEFSANPNKLNEYIINLIFEKYSDDKRIYNDIKNGNVELIKKIQSINLEIQQLQEDIEGKKQEAEINRTRKQGEQTDLIQRIKDVDARQENKSDEQYNLTRKQNELKTTRRQLGSTLQDILQFREKIEGFLDYFKQASDKINQSIKALPLDKDPELIPTNIFELGKILKILVDKVQELECREDDYEKELKEINLKIEALEGSSKEIADLHVKLNMANYELIEIEQEINLIHEKEEKIRSFNQERFNHYLKIIKFTIQQRIFLQDMITKFEVGKNDMLKNLSVSAIGDTRGRQPYLHTLSDKVDNRAHNELSLNEMFLNIFSVLENALNGDDPNVDLSNLITQIEDISNNLKLKRSTSPSDFYNALLSPFFEIGLMIRFNGKNLKDLSMGERAIVLLKILLAFDDKPLLIDQPEEHLDNRYIYAELVPAFRNAKSKRQIIIATHNANLVVNTDAEQIIVANYHNGTLSYEVGALEDNPIKEKIKNILEGGDEAFKKREEKYGYVF